MQVVTNAISSRDVFVDQADSDLQSRFDKTCEALSSKLLRLKSCLETKQYPIDEDVHNDIVSSLESVLASLQTLKGIVKELHSCSTNEVVGSIQQRELEKQLVEVKVLLADSLSRREELSSSLSALKKRQSQDGKTSSSWQVLGSFKGMNVESQVKDDFFRRTKLAEDRAVAAREATKRTKAHLEELQTALRKEEERTKELVRCLDELEERW